MNGDGTKKVTREKPVIAITMGDPAGSAPEVTLKALNRNALYSRAKFMVIGDLKVFEKALQTVGIKGLRLKKVAGASEMEDAPRTIGVLDLANVDVTKLQYGRVSCMGGRASYECITSAVKCALKGEVQAIVTGPISKESLNLAGYRYPGHTELLADLTGAKYVKMMLIAKRMRIAHVTTHVSLRKAIDLIEKKEIFKTIKIVQESLSDLFRITEPEIAVAGLNPHAGENGLFGDEEITEIGPAVEEAQREGMKVSGPYPPDSIFYRAYNGEFDSVIAMYHDQGHIPVKIIDFMKGVNLTLGLPIIRTSPDHGTVWDKAGKGTADETATLEAIKLAIKLARNRIV